jgi:hypothetical protein
MTDRAADEGVGDTTTNHPRRAAAVALAATTMAAAMTEARAMAAAKAVNTFKVLCHVLMPHNPPKENVLSMEA